MDENMFGKAVKSRRRRYPADRETLDIFGAEPPPPHRPRKMVTDRDRRIMDLLCARFPGAFSDSLVVVAAAGLGETTSGTRTSLEKIRKYGWIAATGGRVGMEPEYRVSELGWLWLRKANEAEVRA